MHKFVRSLITEWRRLKLPVEGASVVVAISGGADSCSLLLALDDLRKRKKLDLRIVAAHFNHKLRGDASDADEEFVKQLTTNLRIELAVGNAKLGEQANLEQNAREARYRFLGDTAKRVKAFTVLTAHTMNDQAETLLMNLIRGSGLEGLKAMSIVRLMEEENNQMGEEVEPRADNFLFSRSSPFLIRPLLRWAKRSSTVGFCRDIGIEYRHDSMNDDTAFRRVHIRKILLPLLEDMNPNIIETLANTAFLLQGISSKPYDSVVKRAEADPLVKDLKQLGQAELFEWIRTWLRQKRGNTRAIHLKHVQAIERLISSTKSGRLVELPGKAYVVRSGGKIIYREL